MIDRAAPQLHQLGDRHRGLAEHHLHGHRNGEDGVDWRARRRRAPGADFGSCSPSMSRIRFHGRTPFSMGCCPKEARRRGGSAPSVGLHDDFLDLERVAAVALAEAADETRRARRIRCEPGPSPPSLSGSTWPTAKRRRRRPSVIWNSSRMAVSVRLDLVTPLLHAARPDGVESWLAARRGSARERRHQRGCRNGCGSSSDDAEAPAGALIVTRARSAPASPSARAA